MRAVVDPGPTRLDEFTGRDHSGVAKDGDQIALAAGFDTQHAKAVLGVVEGHPVDQARQDLGWRAPLWCLRHRGMMEVKILGRYRIKPASGAGGVCNRKKASKARCAT